MFAGHYGASLALKKADNKVTAAIAVWLDRKRSPKVQTHPIPATQMNTISTPVEVSQEV